MQHAGCMQHHVHRTATRCNEDDMTCAAPRAQIHRCIYHLVKGGAREREGMLPGAVSSTISALTHRRIAAHKHTPDEPNEPPNKQTNEQRGAAPPQLSSVSVGAARRPTGGKTAWRVRGCSVGCCCALPAVVRCRDVATVSVALLQYCTAALLQCCTAALLRCCTIALLQ